jgi:AraC-like DNA-binding protein
MAKNPKNLSDRPSSQDDFDVVSDVLRAVELSAAGIGRFELTAPWALRVPAADHFSFYVVARGSALLEVEGEGNQRDSEAITLSAGDVAVLAHGLAHRLRDPSGATTETHTLGREICREPIASSPIRIGEGGPATTIVSGAFRFGTSAKSVLLESLPAILHVPAGDPAMTPQLAATVQLILAESAAPGPGSVLLMTRLAEMLLVHALRLQTQRAERTGEGRGQPGLCAIADPQIGKALRLIHSRPADPWTVESLARAVALSRSAFAARFAYLVGEPPLQYLTHWRMNEAAELLRLEDSSVSVVAERVGYTNPAAFMKAFARTHGIGPGSYRRKYRVTRTPPSVRERSRTVDAGRHPM